MTIAVLSATGAQARAIADRLARDHDVVRLSRAAGAGLSPVDTGSEDDLVRALEGARAVVLTSPLDYRPGVRIGLAERVTRAAERAGVGRLVLNLAAAVPADNPRPVAEDLRQIRAVIQSGATPWTVVQPTAYLDNYLAPWALPAIVGDGVIASPAPAEARISYISHASLGDFVAGVIDRPASVGQTYDIGGPEALSGQALADILSAPVGRPLTYQALDLDQFAAGLNAAFGAPTGDDVADIYRHLSERPDALARDTSPWTEIGVEPESAAAWAARQTWRLA